MFYHTCEKVESKIDKFKRIIMITPTTINEPKDRCGLPCREENTKLRFKGVNTLSGCVEHKILGLKQVQQAIHFPHDKNKIISVNI